MQGEAHDQLNGQSCWVPDDHVPVRSWPLAAVSCAPVDADAIQDRLYPADARSEINAIIRALKSHNWYTLNPAVVKIRILRSEQYPASSWFVLGRNLYQAAYGNSQKALEFMAALEAQLGQFPPETAQHLLAGMLYEIPESVTPNPRQPLGLASAAKC